MLTVKWFTVQNHIFGKVQGRGNNKIPANNTQSMIIHLHFGDTILSPSTAWMGLLCVLVHFKNQFLRHEFIHSTCLSTNVDKNVDIWISVDWQCCFMVIKYKIEYLPGTMY